MWKDLIIFWIQYHDDIMAKNLNQQNAGLIRLQETLHVWH